MPKDKISRPQPPRKRPRQQPLMIISTWTDPTTTPTWDERRAENAAQSILYSLPDELMLEVLANLPPEDLYFLRQVSFRFQRLFSDKRLLKFQFDWEKCIAQAKRELPRCMPVHVSSWHRLPLEYRKPYLIAKFFRLPYAPSKTVARLASEPLLCFNLSSIQLQARHAVRERLVRRHFCGPCQPFRSMDTHDGVMLLFELDDKRQDFCGRDYVCGIQQGFPNYLTLPPRHALESSLLPISCQAQMRLCPHLAFNKLHVNAWNLGIAYNDKLDFPDSWTLMECRRCFAGTSSRWAQNPRVFFRSKERCLEMSWAMPLMAVRGDDAITDRSVQAALDQAGELYDGLLCPHFTFSDGPQSLLREFWEKAPRGYIRCPRCLFKYSWRREATEVLLVGTIELLHKGESSIIENTRFEATMMEPILDHNARYIRWCDTEGCAKFQRGRLDETSTYNPNMSPCRSLAPQGRR